MMSRRRGSKGRKKKRKFLVYIFFIEKPNMTSTKTPPVSMPDQVLCKRATVERMKAQHLRWMAQREAALSKQEPLTEQNREESRSPHRLLGIDLAGHPANDPSMASISFTAKTEQPSAQSAARAEMQAVTDAQNPGSHKEPRPPSSAATYSKWPECNGNGEFDSEHLVELDQMQDFLTAMGLQMKEIDHL